ncbi:MAG: SNF2-related protein, partial [Syntrophobacteraceae bacterium]
MNSLKDVLSHLSFRKACKLLGPDGDRLIRTGGRYDIDIDAQATLHDDAFRFLMGSARVTITLDGTAGQALCIRCTKCAEPCIHQGAALSLILEDKVALGLAAPPPQRVPVENLSGEELIQQAIAERRERASNEKMKFTSADPDSLWAEYSVTSLNSGKTYRVSLRGSERGDSYCSCPDFRKNTLGTCKHLMYVMDQLKNKFSAKAWKAPYEVRNIEVHLLYRKELELRLQAPKKIERKVLEVLRPLMNRPITDLHDLFERIGRAGQLGREVTIFPDTEEYLNRRLVQEAIRNKVAATRKDPAHHPLRTSLLKCELLPYQLDGIAFAAGAGRAILADDMGLGKTIQGVGVAEFLAREAGITRVLVVCPASLKSQWRIEIERFTDRPVQMVLGGSGSRAVQYAADSAFFTICNYEQVVRDIDSIERARWDMIILDEGQRIKNWEAKTSRTIKGLKSRFALVLSGTPLENRLDELYSVVEFIDNRRLGPAFQFFSTYRVVDEKGKILGYKNLDELRERLKPILLRRTRKDVMQDLPARTTEIRRIPPSEEQLTLHNGHHRIVQSIIT